MSPYNSIEFYNRKLEVVHHDTIDDTEIDDDYLAPENTTIYISRTDAVSRGCFVYIYGNIEFFGIVDNVRYDNYMTAVEVKPFISLFEHDIIFDTSLQGENGSTSLEEALAKYISEYWIDSYDPFRNISRIQIVLPDASARTMNWDFGLESDSEDLSRCIVAFHSEIICRALKEYGVGVKTHFDLNRRILTLDISTWSKVESSRLIDANLETVTVSTFEVDQMNKDVNCLEIWNDKARDEEESRLVYCLRKDGSYSYIQRVNEEDRVLPVKLSVRSVNPEGTNTFAYLAAVEAKREFANAKWNSLIELKVACNDYLVDPVGLPIGTMVNIDYLGREYQSILTGKKLSSVVTLVFGMVRADYTKQLKIRW